MKTKNLDRFMKGHRSHCKIWEFSLQKDRYCSCGLDRAREELEVLKAAMRLLEKVDWWLEKGEPLGASSVAHQDIDELLERANQYG